jgi:hypothetical protein
VRRAATTGKERAATDMGGGAVHRPADAPLQISEAGSGVNGREVPSFEGVRREAEQGYLWA